MSDRAVGQKTLAGTVGTLYPGSKIGMGPVHLGNVVSWYAPFRMQRRHHDTLGRALRDAWALARKLWRLSRPVTWMLGPRHHRHRRRIEVDVTWACNLRCFNCNRSCEQAPTNDHMTLDQIESFVRETVARGIRWERIRLLGGEPTVHPSFLEIVRILRAYRAEHSPDTVLEVATNGHGEHVTSVLARLPADVVVLNTAKTSPAQPGFRSFNAAPSDSGRYRFSDYRNGCWIIEKCGFGLGPNGYYPCAIAAGIDRVVGADAGRPSLPLDDDDMTDQLDRFCRLCGHFKVERERGVDGPVQSPVWKAAYARHRAQPARLTRYR